MFLSSKLTGIELIDTSGLAVILGYYD